MTELNSIIRNEIKELKKYSISNSNGLIKLDAMENPYSWDEDYRQKWLTYLTNIKLNRYPDPNAQNLNELLRENMLVPKNANLILGNGSDELIQIILMSLPNNSTILSPIPSFVMYQMIAKLTQVNFVGVPLTADFELDLDLMLFEIEIHKPAVIFIANPNNPTGNLFDRNKIEKILNKTNGLVVIDEAYFSFSDVSFMQDLNKYENLLVMRTVSKMGLAGIRLGMLVGTEKWLNEFNKVRLPYNINSLTQKTAEFVLKNTDILDKQIVGIKKNRVKLFNDLQAISGVTVFKSNANFILFLVENAEEIYQALKDNGILIKNLSGTHPLLKNCLRVTVGSEYENQKFIQTFLLNFSRIQKS